MPGAMNGVQRAVEAGRTRPDLRIVLTPGYTGEALMGERRVPTDIPILTKPRREELAARLRVAARATGDVAAPLVELRGRSGSPATGLTSASAGALSAGRWAAGR